MESIKGMDGEDKNFNIQHSKKTPDLPSLPEELITYIFSNLKEVEINNAKSTNKIWEVKALDYNKSSFNFLINWLTAHLDESQVDQKIAKNALMSETKILGTTTLQDVKSITHDLTEEIIGILIKLDTNDLVNLSKVFKIENKHQRFENLFDLIQVYKRIFNIEKNIQKKHRDLALSKTVGSLVTLGKLEKALDVAKTIDCTPFRNKGILNIIRALGKLHQELHKKKQYNGAQHFNDAIKIISTLEKYDYSAIFDPKKFDSIEEFNISVFVTLSFQLFLRNQLDKVLELASLFSDKDVILESMAIEQSLKRPNHRNYKILELVDKISDPLSKDLALHHIKSLASSLG